MVFRSLTVFIRLSTKAYVSVSPDKPLACSRVILGAFGFPYPGFLSESSVYAREVVFEEILPLLADLPFTFFIGGAFLLFVIAFAIQVRG